MISLKLKFILLFLTILFATCMQHNESEKTGNPENTDTTKSNEKNDPFFQRAFAIVNGMEMYYEIHGSGSPLVLIHGGGSTIYTTFGRILPLLAGKHKIIAVELQAHGHSGDRNSPESFEQDADDVAELLKQLDINKSDIFGFSNGGSTALQIAIRHPERVNKLVVASAMFKRAGMHPWFWDFMQKGTFKDMPQVYKDAFLKINPKEEKLLNMFHKDHQRMLTFKDWKDQDVKSIKSPALVIVGDKDVVRPEHALETAHLLPNARLAILPGGHGDFIGEIMSPNPASKIPALTVAMIEEFLDEPASK